MKRLSEVSLHSVWPALIGIAAFSASALATPFVGYGWHDQQRVAQLCLTLLLTAQLYIVRPTGGVWTWGLLLILGLGLASASVAQFPSWAIREWALLAGLMLQALVVARLFRSAATQWVVLGIAGVVGFLLALQFFVGYAAAFLTGIRLVDAYTLFSGFSNPRFLGQFQAMLLPLLAYLVMQLWQPRRALACLALIALAAHWCIAFALAGRGLLLGLALANASLLLFGGRYIGLLRLQVAAAALGLLLFALMFFCLPQWLGIDLMLRDALRGGLSARELIWTAAWDMAINRPWFGVGPMHFSAHINPVAAHPHQVVLQWAAEWGLPAAFLALSLGGWGLIRAWRFMHFAQHSSIDAALWVGIVAALLLAQVDGVLVMPYAQTWLALLIGIALSRWSSGEPTAYQLLLLRLVALLVIATLGHVLLVDAPELPETQQLFMEQQANGGRPRFWSQGWIPGQ